MLYFTQLAALAALAAHADAACKSRGDFDCDSFEQKDEVEAAVNTYAGGYTWSMWETDAGSAGYKVKMFRFVGNAADESITNDAGEDIQNTRGQVLLVHSITQTALNWFTNTEDENIDSIPQQMFNEGYDVWIACMRGTDFSQGHETFDLSTDEDRELYFNYNTYSVGQEDIGQMMSTMWQARADEGLGDCDNKVQIVSFGLGAGAVLSSLFDNASYSDKINLVTNLAPCLVPTYHLDIYSDPDTRLRMLADKQSTEEAVPRELQQAVDEDMSRNLSKRKRGDKRDPWAKTKKYCMYYPEKCYEYCEWYPALCDEFCENLPEYCTPEEVRNFYQLKDVMDRLKIFSRHGPNWGSEVEAICAEEDAATCEYLEGTVGSPRREISDTQWEHMFQMNFSHAFTLYSENFEEDQTVEEIDVSSVTNRMINIYHPETDDKCDVALNKGILDTVDGQLWSATITEAGLDRLGLQGANDNYDFVSLLFTALDIGSRNTDGSSVC